MATAQEGNKQMALSSVVKEVRELFLGRSRPAGTPMAFNAMSPKVSVSRLSPKLIEKYTMMGLVKSETVSDDEDQWLTAETDPAPEPDWEQQDWDMNILEPLVEISDKPKDSPKKRRKRQNNEEGRKRNKQGNTQKQQLKESVFVDVSIKQESPEPEEEMTTTVPGVPMTTIHTEPPTLPMFPVSTPGLTMFMPPTQPVVAMNYPNNALNRGQNSSDPTASNKTGEELHGEVGLGANIKEEQMENVFVMPFGSSLEGEKDKSQAGKPSSPDPDIIECESPAEIARKNRTAAIAASLGGIGALGAGCGLSHKKLRELTFKLVELNNKNLQCDDRLEKVHDEYKKRISVIEGEKKSIEQEIDRVLSNIQEWKEARRQTT